MPEHNNDFRMKMTEWRGYVIRALEDLDQEMKEVKKSQIALGKKIDKINSKLTGLLIKTAAMSGTIGAIAGFLTAFLS